MKVPQRYGFGRKGVGMKRVLFTVCVAVASLVVLPGIARGQVLGQDSVIGGGDFGSFADLSVNVSSGPSGENPTGDASVILAGVIEPFRSASVDCLAVNGNQAVFAGALSPNPFGVTHYKLVVVDTGVGAPTPDMIGLATTSGGTPLDCSSFGANSPLTGDIVVTDAQPFPTTKDQCKNGGWRNYVVFKNQGDCVSFVATGERTRQPDRTTTPPA